MVFYNRDGNECIASCSCGCGDSVQFSVLKDYEFSGSYFYQTLLDAKWNAEQRGFRWKLKKIWAILRNKDFHYSEICMSKAEFDQFKEWINKF